MRTELDVVLLLKELRMLRILALKSVTTRAIEDAARDEAFTPKVCPDDSMTIDEFFDVLRSRGKEHSQLNLSNTIETEPDDRRLI